MRNIQGNAAGKMLRNRNMCCNAKKIKCTAREKGVFSLVESPKPSLGGVLFISSSSSQPPTSMKSGRPSKRSNFPSRGLELSLTRHPVSSCQIGQTSNQSGNLLSVCVAVFINHSIRDRLSSKSFAATKPLLVRETTSSCPSKSSSEKKEDQQNNVSPY